MNSRVSASVNAQQSTTWVPDVLITLMSWPALSRWVALPPAGTTRMSSLTPGSDMKLSCEDRPRAAGDGHDPVTGRRPGRDHAWPPELVALGDDVGGRSPGGRRWRPAVPGQEIRDGGAGGPARWFLQV